MSGIIRVGVASCEFQLDDKATWGGGGAATLVEIQFAETGVCGRPVRDELDDPDFEGFGMDLRTGFLAGLVFANWNPQETLCATARTAE